MSGQPAMDYPALYDGASEASAASQSNYLALLRTEYVLLILASVFSLDLSRSTIYYASYAFIFVCSLAVLLFRSKTKPEQDWYRARALAESIKTMTWRYCMRAAPFDTEQEPRALKEAFRVHLSAVLSANRNIAGRMKPDSATKDQITTAMGRIRDLPLEERKKYYASMRIGDQRNWYIYKAEANKRAEVRWVFVSSAVYSIAIALVLLRIALPSWTIWPIEPIIVVASTIVGWMQIKKFNELASAYTLTAHEIGILQGRVEDVESELQFSEFVNEAELAFSREHTQWVARQTQ